MTLKLLKQSSGQAESGLDPNSSHILLLDISQDVPQGRINGVSDVGEWGTKRMSKPVKKKIFFLSHRNGA